MRAKLHFQRRGQSDDGYGNGGNTGPFETVFTDNAELIPRMGSEAIISSRLQGIQPYTIRIYSHEIARSIDATWRAVDARSGAVYSLVSPPVNTDQKNRYIEMLATVGGQTDA